LFQPQMFVFRLIGVQRYYFVPLMHKKIKNDA
jgi:hypothetical protein